MSFDCSERDKPSEKIKLHFNEMPFLLAKRTFLHTRGARTLARSPVHCAARPGDRANEIKNYEERIDAIFSNCTSVTVTFSASRFRKGERGRQRAPAANSRGCNFALLRITSCLAFINEEQWKRKRNKREILMQISRFSGAFQR